MYPLEGELPLGTTALPGPGLVPTTVGPLSDATFGIPMDDPQSMTDPWRSNSDFLVILLTHAITFIVGVIGNTIVIATWARGGKIRSPTATFLVSLACADLLLLTVFLPLETLEYFVITWDREGHICKLSSFVELLSGIASILNLVAVSVERYVQRRRERGPFHSPSPLSPRQIPRHRVPNPGPTLVHRHQVAP